ncbi:polymerase [Campylobacter jejuni]|uniref:hypothetical protein n=1 Tax=Campylobacter jejuni TaxID=197 RepID=UPI0002581D45|nr:hypothetical protein [Campylobacter jejuni]EAI4438445.1 molybdate metabolism regulator [Campylobacter jejuni]ECL9356610.1 molybdate metabolism regulator [Campylobacter jejuni]ECQ5124350.1 molybdate metabolism regulator [Campylobacter jejuni]ECR2497841.1 molybdate metabolism regulator [Campylobacter jejuni]EDP6220850.1 molybdate metabolism regulator [Campylobacter jejuni]
MNNVLLHRITKKGNIRYYSIEIIATLFEEYMVERVYRNVRLKVAQEEKIMYFQVLMRHKFFEKLKKQKMKKEYT